MDYLNYYSDNEVDDEIMIPEPDIKSGAISIKYSAPQPLALTLSTINKISNTTSLPLLEPKNPFIGSAKTNQKKPHEEIFIDDFHFNQSYTDYNVNVTTNNIASSDKLNKKKKDKKRKLFEGNELLVDDMNGPWSPIESNVDIVSSNNVLDIKSQHSKKDSDIEDSDHANVPANVHILEPDQESEKWEKVNERKQSYVLPRRPNRGESAIESKTIFHGTEAIDYQGRPWTHVPAEIKHSADQEHESYIPKKCIKKYLGHSKGVQVIELFPKYGHLLLSGSMDGKCMIWDVYNDKNLKRTYMGHSEGVRSVHMSNDGSRFLSSSFDRYVRLWDLETGQAVNTFSNR